MLDKNLKKNDPKIWNIIQKENVRQENHIELIASENYVSLSVLQAQGSQLTNKYAEGYPNNRYYGGCQYVDEIENIAITRAKILFNADFANVQPHSGSQANFSVYTALLKPGDCVLGMNLSDGGHLTHGCPVNLSGQLYNFVSYGVNEKGVIDYDKMYTLAKKNKPKMIVGGFSAYSGLCDWKIMREIADNVKAYLLVDMAHIAGLVSCDLYPSPIPYAHIVTSTTHKTLAGPRGGLILSNEKNALLYKKLNSSVFPGNQGGPLMHVIAAKAIAFKEAMSQSFKNYQKQIIKNAKVMVQTFLKRNYDIVTGNTYNHLFLVDLRKKELTGKDADLFLSNVNITVNKNSIPNDLKSPFITSGIRIGTPAITRRGFKEKEAQHIANWIIDVLNEPYNTNNTSYIKSQVLKLCKKYPVYKKHLDNN